MIPAIAGSAGVTPATFALTPSGTDGDFSFIVIGDTGEGDASQHALRDQLLTVAARRDVRFVVVSSDVVYPNGSMIDVDEIDEKRMLLLEDGHCLKDHALSACNRPELRAHAAMMGTSLHTLVQMVDNGLGLTFIPAMAIESGILDGTRVDAKPLRSEHGFRRVALIWRRSSPREAEFQLLATALRRIIRERVPEPASGEQAEPALDEVCG